MMYRLMVIDDEYLVRLGIRETINWAEHGIEIVGEATNGQEGLDLAKRLMPDVIISDVRMPVMDGLELIQKINEEKLDTIVIMLSGYKDFDYAKETLESGAFSYLLKPIDNLKLVEGVLKAIDKLNQRRNEVKKAQQLDQELPLLKEAIIQSLFSGGSVGDLKDKIALCHISIPARGYVIFGRIDDVESFIEKALVKKACDDLFGIIAGELTSKGITFLQQNTFNSFAFITGNALDTNGYYSLLDRCLKVYEETHEEIVSLGLSEMYQNINDIYERYTKAREYSRNKLFFNLNTLSTKDSNCQKYRRVVVEALKYISLNYQDDISIRDVSEALMVSESQLMHVFKEDFGKTFNECLTDYRIRLAGKLLLSEKYRVYEIASMVGIPDAKYFSQVFRKVTGLAPGDYVLKYKRAAA
jgi:two-component system response regulator YesN